MWSNRRRGVEFFGIQLKRLTHLEISAKRQDAEFAEKSAEFLRQGLGSACVPSIAP
jgi:hypothetical protein